MYRFSTSLNSYEFKTENYTSNKENSTIKQTRHVSINLFISYANVINMNGFLNNVKTYKHSIYSALNHTNDVSEIAKSLKRLANFTTFNTYRCKIRKIKWDRFLASR